MLKCSCVLSYTTTWELIIIPKLEYENKFGKNQVWLKFVGTDLVATDQGAGEQLTGSSWRSTNCIIIMELAGILIIFLYL